MCRMPSEILCLSVLCHVAFADEPATSVVNGSFGEVMSLGSELNSTGNDWFPAISADGLTLFFASDRAGSFGSNDIYEVTRESRDEPFFGIDLRKVDELNTSRNDVPGSLSPDGNTLYFSTPSERGDWDIHMAIRELPDRVFTQVMNLGPAVNSMAVDGPAKISGDGNILVFYSSEDGTRDLYQVTRLETGEFGDRMKLGEGSLSTFMEERDPCLSFDGLTLFFGEHGTQPLRPGGLGGGDIWVARRETTSDPFCRPVNLNSFSAGSSVNTPAQNAMPAISADWPTSGAELYFVQFSTFSPGLGGADLWVSKWTVLENEESILFLRGDCTGDGEVNISDATCALARLFAGGAAPGCLAALNTNGDGDVNIADPVALLNFLFGGGPSITEPFPDCGPSTLPADEELGCEEPPDCQ